MRKIAIVGVGLIGGSIGLALRKKRLAKEVVGIGHRQSSINKAKRLGLIDRGTLNLKQGIDGADIIIVATPTNIIKKKLMQVLRYASPPSIICDVNSTKHDIIKVASSIPDRFSHFVGTHPMAGSEKRGHDVARGDLFKGHVCFLTPAKKTSSKALNKVKGLWQKLGSEVIIISPQKHDRLVAEISHLPHAIAYALASMIERNKLKFASGSFRDVTRVAKSPPGMWANILIANKQNTLKAIKLFLKEFELIAKGIKRSDRSALLKLFRKAKIKRDGLG